MNPTTTINANPATTYTPSPPRRQPLGPGGKPKPYQPTFIRAKTARSIIYLESHGLADFSDCNLKVVPNKRLVKRADGTHKSVPITDGSPTGGV